ncbi:MAG: hypothetical protein HDQ87_08445 [Clostridia bacterium]|nr:hypothetical protein [Clostridia bacterium]
MDSPSINGEEYRHGTLYRYEIREYLLDKYGHTCQYSGGKSGGCVLEWEHIVPRPRDSSDMLSNTTLACRRCNQDKGSKDFPVGSSRNMYVSRKRKCGLWRAE